MKQNTKPWNLLNMKYRYIVHKHGAWQIGSNICILCSALPHCRISNSHSVTENPHQLLDPYTQPSSGTTIASTSGHCFHYGRHCRTSSWTQCPNRWQKWGVVTEYTFKKNKLLPIIVVLYKCLSHAALFIVHTRVSDANDLAVEARVQDPNSCPAVDGALHITKAHTISWGKIMTKQI